MNRSYLLTALLAVFLLPGCAYFSKYGSLTRQSKTNFASGRYADAVVNVVNALKIKPDYVAAQDQARQIIPDSRSRILNAIEGLKQQSATFSGDDTVTKRAAIVGQYEDLVRLMQAAASLPPFLHVASGETVHFPYEDYTGMLADSRHSLNEAKQQAAEMHYSKGMELMAAGSKDSARLATAEFKRSLEFVSDYKDAMLKYMMARSAGTSQVGLLGIDTGNVWPLGETIGDPLERGVMDALIAKAPELEFTSFVDRATMLESIESSQIDLDQAYRSNNKAAEIGRKLGLDQVIIGSVNKVDIAPPVSTSNANNHRKVTTPATAATYDYSSGQAKLVTPAQPAVYATAATTTYKKTIKATMEVQWKLLNCKTGKVVTQAKTIADDTWESPQWATLNGDRKALDATTLQLVNRPEPDNVDSGKIALTTTEKAVAKIAEQLLQKMK